MKEIYFMTIISIICSLFCSGCVIEKYTVKGRASIDDQRISNINVTISCPKNYPRSKSSFTDDEGHYVLEGNGRVEGCDLLFEHPGLNTKNILIEKKYLKDKTYPAAPIYEINVRMGRKE